MYGYLKYIVLIDCFVLGIMCILIGQNQMLEKNRKVKFILTFVILAILSILELITLMIDGKSDACKIINAILNFIGFSLSPVLPLMFGLCIYDLKKEYIIGLSLFIGCYIVTLFFLIMFGKFFYYDANNFYHRGPLFFIYTIMYGLTTVVLLAIMILVSSNYDLKNQIIVYLLFIAFLVGGGIQIFLPTINVSQFTLTILSIVFYAFFNQLWQQKDGLTGLFSQHCYLRKLDDISRNCTIMMMDVDDFKGINDTFGHMVGDDCLVIVSKCIKQVFNKYGSCYRIGGDEFCVILSEQANPAKLTNLFQEKIAAERKKHIWMPHVSVGWAEYTKGDEILAVKDKADMKMYYYKEYRKNSANYYKN